MSVEIKLKKKVKEDSKSETPTEQEICDLDKIGKLYTKKCGSNNKQQLQIELENREELGEDPNSNEYLYPTLDDPNFNIKIFQKKRV